MKIIFSLSILIFVCLAYTSMSISASSVPNIFCDPSREDFVKRHAANQAFENNDYLERMWKQEISIIAQIPIGPGGSLQWLEVAQIKFWMNTTYNAEGCYWDERQMWERYDPATGELIEIGVQRIDLLINGPSQGIDFLGDRGFEERASTYSVDWYQNRYLQESVSVLGTEVVEYALGDSVVAGAWYKDGKLVFQNSVLSYIPGESRSYTYSIIERGIPGNDLTTYKVLANIASTNVVPPQYILDASDFLHESMEDPNFVGRLNPLTGIYEYVFELNQSGAKRSVKNCLNTECNMDGFSVSKYINKAMEVAETTE